MIALSPRDRRALGGGGLVVAVLLIYLLWPDGDPGSQAGPEPLAQPVVAAAAPPPPPPVPAPAPLPAADPGQLRLFGILGRGAVIAGADGNQRYVPLGREVAPGLRLVRLEVRHAVLAVAGGEIRLGFDGVAQAQAPPPGQAAAAPAGEAALRDRTRQYRLGLAPRMAGGRVTGFAVRPGAELPELARAGVQPGDVIVSVNGSVLDEERMLELAWTMANSNRVDFEVERGGRRVRLSGQGR